MIVTLLKIVSLSSWVDEAKDRHPIRIHAAYNIVIWTGISSGSYQQLSASFNCILFYFTILCMFLSSSKFPLPSRKINSINIGASPDFWDETRPELTIVRRRGGEKSPNQSFSVQNSAAFDPTDASSSFNNSRFPILISAIIPVIISWLMSVCM